MSESTYKMVTFSDGKRLKHSEKINNEKKPHEKSKRELSRSLDNKALTDLTEKRLSLQFLKAI